MSSPIYLPRVELVYSSLNSTDQFIANFFFNEANEITDLSAKNVAHYLHLSESSLTRFAQKCGYEGYRQLIYDVENSKAMSNPEPALTNNVLADYTALLNKASELVQEDSLRNICQDIVKQKDLYIYGIGHSGLAAKEMELRFNRIGIRCKAITDADQILVNAAILDEDCLIIGLTLSGQKQAVTKALELASGKQAKTYLLTTQKADYPGVDELILVPSLFNLSYGNRISPQFPLLVIIDLIYDALMRTNRPVISKIFETTLSLLDKKDEGIGNE